MSVRSSPTTPIDLPLKATLVATALQTAEGPAAIGPANVREPHPLTGPERSLTLNNNNRELVLNNNPNKHVGEVITTSNALLVIDQATGHL